MQDILEFDSSDLIIEFSKYSETNSSSRFFLSFVWIVNEIPVSFKIIFIIDILNKIDFVFFSIISGEMIVSSTNPNSQSSIS